MKEMNIDRKKRSRLNPERHQRLECERDGKGTAIEIGGKPSDCGTLEIRVF